MCKSCLTYVTEGQASEACSSCHGALHVDCKITEADKVYCDGCYMQKEAEPEKVDFTIPDVIRRSYIETYKSCPYKFLKQVIEGNDMPPNCYTQIGIDLHDLFEIAILDRGYAIEQMRKEFQRIWDEVYPDMNLFKDAKQQDDMYQRAQDSMNTFYHIIQDMPMPLMTEETIVYSIGDDIPKIQFTMDIVFENDEGELELVDWKTGQVMVGKKLSSDLQAPLYIYGVQQHLGRPVKRFTFYYLKDNKVRVFEHVHGDEYVCTVGKRKYIINLQEALKEVGRMFAQINKGNFNIPRDTKGMYFTCKMCHIKEMGLCEGADMQAWHNTW